MDLDLSTISEETSGQKNRLSIEAVQQCSNIFKQTSQYYLEENKKMEAMFKRMKLLTDENKLRDLPQVETLDQILRNLDVENFSPESIELVRAEELRKKNIHLERMKMNTRHYMQKNENVTKDIEFLKSELENAKDRIKTSLHLDPKGVQNLEEKAKKYQSEIKRFESKFPYLKQPEYNIQNMAAEMENIKCLREERDQLERELSVYKNLKPDLKEAKRQLTTLKEELKTMSGLNN